MWLPLKLFFVILQILALPLHCVTLLILLLYNLAARLSAKVFQDFVGPIPGSNAVFLGDNIWSRPHCSVIVGVQLGGTPTVEEVIKLLQNVYDYRDHNGQRCYRELGYYLVRYLGYGFWKNVPDFALAQRIHIIRGGIIEQNGNHVYKDSPSSPIKEEEPLALIVERLLRTPYAKDQPLWDVYLLYEYMGNANETLVLMRFHHLMADGMSFVKFFYALTGSNKLPETFTKPTTTLQKWDRIANSTLFKISTAVSVITVGIVEYFYELLLKKDRNCLNYSDNGKLNFTGNWICYMTNKLDVLEMKKASRQYGCSIAHIILAGVGSGVEKYFEKYHSGEGDKPIPEGIHYILPLPIPKHPNLRLVNHWCITKFHAKFGIEKTAEKMEFYKEEVKRTALNNLPTIVAITFQYISTVLPKLLVDLAAKPKGVFTLGLSNVVGPQDDRRLADSTIMDMFFFMPLIQESMAIAIGVISCNGKLRICLTTDIGSIPDRSHLEDLGMMVYTETQNICNGGNTDKDNGKNVEIFIIDR